jgi:hypothetical protein
VASAKVKLRIESKAIASLAATTRPGGPQGRAEGDQGRGERSHASRPVGREGAWSPSGRGCSARVIGRKVKSYRGGAVITGIVGPRKGFRTVINGVPSTLSNTRIWLSTVGGKCGRRRRRCSPVRACRSRARRRSSSGPWQRVIYGKKVRSVAPRPFMRPAWEHNASCGRLGIIIQHLHRALKEFFARARSGRKR